VTEQTEAPEATYPPLVPTPPALRSEVEDLYAHYATIIDEKRPNEWVDLFATEGLYAVGTHNNVSTTGMWWNTDRDIVALKERAAYTNGYFWHNPTKTLHTISNVRAQEREDGSVAAQAYFVMYVADRTDPSVLHVVGRYEDILVRERGQLRFREHRVVIDAETVPANMGVLL
jgi:3-phenylpropionate/cinnamic acid dioxygenase small subunit